MFRHYALSSYALTCERLNNWSRAVVFQLPGKTNQNNKHKQMNNQTNKLYSHCQGHGPVPARRERAVDRACAGHAGPEALRLFLWWWWWWWWWLWRWWFFLLFKLLLVWLLWWALLWILLWYTQRGEGLLSQGRVVRDMNYLLCILRNTCGRVPEQFKGVWLIRGATTRHGCTISGLEPRVPPCSIPIQYHQAQVPANLPFCMLALEGRYELTTACRRVQTKPNKTSGGAWKSYGRWPPPSKWHAANIFSNHYVIAIVSVSLFLLCTLIMLFAYFLFGMSEECGTTTPVKRLAIEIFSLPLRRSTREPDFSEPLGRPGRHTVYLIEVDDCGQSAERNTVYDTSLSFSICMCIIYIYIYIYVNIYVNK